MVRSSFVWLLGVFGVLGCCPAARADFPAAMKDFNEGRYEASHEQFLSGRA